jgi:thioredoxin reductase (NADPH)
VSVWANAVAGPLLPTETLNAVVVGGGPAAYTAAIYLARAKADPVVLAGTAPGGLLMDTGIVENFPGFPDGIDGPELMARMREQAERAGATVFALDAREIRLAAAGAAPVHEVATAEGDVRTRTLVLATGSAPRTLGVPGEAELGGGRGVAYCAVCEAPLFRGRDVAVVGGGDSAMEEALALARHARRVRVIHRGETFRAAAVMLERVRALPNVELRTGAVVRAAHADDDGRLARISVQRTADGTSEELAVQGLFVAIGHTPRSELLRGALPLRASDHVCRTGPGGATDRPGVFVAGDVADARFRQAVTAAGAGCAAALEAARYLEEIR